METLLSFGFTNLQLGLMLFIVAYGIPFGIGNCVKRFINLFVGREIHQADWAKIVDTLWMIAVILLWVDLSKM